MPKKHDGSKQIPLTEAEKRNLDRFGCAFKAKTGVFCLDWRGKSLASALEAEIFACIARIDTEAGSLIVLAFEVSPIRPLPMYFYFPFDLRNQAHRKYLSQLAETGEVRICFYSGRKAMERTHRLTPHLLSCAADICKCELDSPQGERQFEAALQALEGWIKVPNIVDHLLTEASLAEISKRVSSAAETVPAENRDFARCIVDGAFKGLKPHYDRYGRAMFEHLQRVRNGITLLADFRRLFADNQTDLREFVAQAIAGSFSQRELQNLENLVKVVISFSNLPVRPETEPAAQVFSTIPEVPLGLVAVTQLMATRGLSSDSLRKFCELVGLKIGARPGRRREDYSKEYELKASGLSWAQVAERALAGDPDLQAEFGGGDYRVLSFEAREKLKHRIREGVRSYAKLAGRPFPPRLERIPSAVREEQKNQ